MQSATCAAYVESSNSGHLWGFKMLNISLGYKTELVDLQTLYMGSKTIALCFESHSLVLIFSVCFLDKDQA